jgi:hypothetical protein
MSADVMGEVRRREGRRCWQAREFEFWDPARWQPQVLAQRFRCWVDATRRRRRIVWLLAVTLVLVVFPGVVGAVAVAQTQSGTAAGRSSIGMLHWMDVRDSSGVRLTDYTFATSHGSLFRPWETIVSMVLGLEFVGYMVIVTAAIWLIGFAISFRWLDPFGRALTGVADNLTGQIATPSVLFVAAAIGAFCPHKACSRKAATWASRWRQGSTATPTRIRANWSPPCRAI